ncbi:MAG: UDP-N-acetylmuramate dehydrogenase [Candidatus Doudnabacteria bacterium]|nr:UDP-N-acetylmuramate dehydrogenase [Candidatus Doudnabacteria bacterium]
MQIQENVILAPYTTFKIGGPARYFCIVKDQFDALEAYEFAKEKKLKTFVLGGGSNLLISDEGFDGLVIKVVNKGIEVLKEDESRVLLRVASGEVWDEVVRFAVTNNWWGIENLSHIPGSSGAIAVQNVGAYGQEASRVIESVTVFNKDTHQIISINNQDCKFAYRKSIFNSEEKGKYIIFNIDFNLSKIPAPVLSYRDLSQKFTNSIPSLSEIRSAVIEIRNKKFPFPVEAKNGNAGSFFKNPILEGRSYQELKNKLANSFGASAVEALEKKKFEEGNVIKVPAAYLIDICGLKELKNGGAAINKNQPLVIINHSGKATAKDVLGLAEKVKEEVYSKTGISLFFEPELIGFN